MAAVERESESERSWWKKNKSRDLDRGNSRGDHSSSNNAGTTQWKDPLRFNLR